MKKLFVMLKLPGLLNRTRIAADSLGQAFQPGQPYYPTAADDLADEIVDPTDSAAAADWFDRKFPELAGILDAVVINRTFNNVGGG